MFEFEWAQKIGLLIRKQSYPGYGTGVAPFTLFPSPFPRKFYEQAVNVQTALNLLYFRIMRDYPFLKEIYQKLIKFDQTLSTALKIMEEIHSEGIKQPLTVLFQRADYMLCESNYEGNENPSYELKQVEVNGSAIGGLGFATKTSKLHQQILSEMGLDLSNSVENNTRTMAVEAIYQAWQKFGDPKAIIILIFDERYAFFFYERSNLYFELKNKFEGQTEIVALNLNQCAKLLKLDPHDFTLRYDDKIVAVVFNQETMISADTKKMEARRTIERSTAIKAPSLAAALAHTKKVQQVLAKPGMVERFFPNPEEAPLIDAIRNTYVNFWTVEEDNNEYTQIIQAVKKNPHNFVLKKTEYALNNQNLNPIYFGEEIVKSIANFTPPEPYILMEKLQSTIVKNHIVKTMFDTKQNVPTIFDIVVKTIFDKKKNVPPSILEDVTPELGIFGTLLGNIVDGQVLHNAQMGSKIKTKLASENEGGLDRGQSAYDSAYLVD
uniref:Glutathione synthetase n=1 Tax=Globodera pallida TaxID=36090 RepID=A0A183BLB4_GLOPA